MADHLITGTLTYVVIVCGRLSCQKTWEQPNTPIEDPGWNVCPGCLWSAPTNVSDAAREQAEAEAIQYRVVSVDTEGHQTATVGFSDNAYAQKLWMRANTIPSVARCWMERRAVGGWKTCSSETGAVLRGPRPTARASRETDASKETP